MIYEEMNQAQLVEELTRAVWSRAEASASLHEAQEDRPRWWQRRRKKLRALRIAMRSGRLAQRERDVSRIVAALVQTSAQFYAKAKDWEAARRERRDNVLAREMADLQRHTDMLNGETAAKEPS